MAKTDKYLIYEAREYLKANSRLTINGFILATANLGKGRRLVKELSDALEHRVMKDNSKEAC